MVDFIKSRLWSAAFLFLALSVCLLVVLPALLRSILFVQSLRSFHDRVGWKAEDYFQNPQTVALCHAIEEGDLEEIDRLVEAGADVNAQGERGMTPLLWAYPDNQLDRFQKLLKLGADPNVTVQSDFHTRGTIRPGMSITHLAAGTRFAGYFKAVMEHGGDPDLASDSGETPLHIIIRVNLDSTLKQERIQLLIDRDVDLNAINGNLTPAMMAVSLWRQYELALLLLKAGASPTATVPGSNRRLVHTVVNALDRQKLASVQKQEALAEILEILEEHGESIAEAKQDVERWTEWAKVHPASKVKELHERELRERAAELEAN